MQWNTIGWLSFVTLAACQPTQPTTDAHAPAPSASGAPSAGPSTTAPRPPPPASTSLAIVNVGGGRFAIENGGDAPARVKLAAAIERKTDTGWTPLYIDVRDGYRLVEECPRREAQLDACVDVAAHGELDPARWTGFNCSGQCNMICRANAYEGPGTFRLVVSTCDGARVEGLPFDMPSDRGTAALDRWTIATGVVSATAVRLSLPSAPNFRADVPATPDHVAGFAVRPGTEHALDAASLGALRGLLQAEHGFDDQMLKRCALHDLVGVRVVREMPSTGTARRETVDIALDFTCKKLFAAFGEGKHRTAMATQFDPSQKAFAAWAKGAFP